MDVNKVGQITDAEVYLDDTKLVGRFKELTLPNVESTEIKHETLGQIAVIMLPGRPLKELKGKIVLEFLDKDLLRRFQNPTKPTTLSTHHFVDVFDQGGLEAPKGYRIITTVTFLVSKTGGKAQKLGDNMEGEYDINVLAFSQRISTESTPLIEIDVMTQTYNVNGEPVWPRY